MSKEPPKNPPSEIFTRTLSRSGGIVSDCEWCGRTFFEDDEHAGDWEPGELEALRKRAKAEPDKCIPMEHVGRCEMDGKTYIIGCPCNALTPYEEFIWDYRQFIMAYISARVKDIVERALDDEGASDQATADLVREQRARETVRCPKCLKFVSQIAMSEGGICVKCWEQTQKVSEQESKTTLEKMQEADAKFCKEEERKRTAQEKLDDDYDLPF